VTLGTGYQTNDSERDNNLSPLSGPGQTCKVQGIFKHADKRGHKYGNMQSWTTDNEWVERERVSECGSARVKDKRDRWTDGVTDSKARDGSSSSSSHAFTLPAGVRQQADQSENRIPS
jgi:hypothetical protein